MVGILSWAKVVRVCDLPKGTKVIGSTTQRKFKCDGTAKTPVCVQGFSQIHNIHYDRKQSPLVTQGSPGRGSITAW